MDPKDIKIQELETQLATATKERDTFKGQANTLSGQIATLSTRVADLDGIVKQKNDDIVGLRKQNQKLKKPSEMSDDEKNKLSEVELALLEQKEIEDREAEERRVADETARNTVRDSRYDALIKKRAGEDSAYAEKIKAQLGFIKGADAPLTDEDFDRYTSWAESMVPKPEVDPILGSMGAGGDMPPEQKNENNGFADSQAGKSLADALNI